MNTIRVAIIGLGSRGRGFASMVHEHPNATVVAVAEPIDSSRQAAAETFGLADDMVFRDWQSFVSARPDCDAVVIATMDRDHVGPAVACQDLGCHMFLEKPMATTLPDCEAIAAAQRRNNTITIVCHSMRYHLGCDVLKRRVDAGEIGDIVSMDQLEQVAWWHQAHSFVRGNWGNEGRATFMLLAKSCHDIDYMSYLIGSDCLRVSSFGSLTYFTEAHAPEGSGERCVDCGIEPDCAYSAVKTYLTEKSWMAELLRAHRSPEELREEIRTGPYGRCVWRTDNDVVDHQVVAMEHANGVTATFTMTGFTHDGGRMIRVHGTEGELYYDQAVEEITHKHFATRTVETQAVTQESGSHGGGDERVVNTWLQAIADKDSTGILTDVHESLRTHRIVFAAEQSRREKRQVELLPHGS